LALDILERRIVPSVVLGQQPGAPNTQMFHADSAKSGFYQNETVLTKANVAAGFGQVWQSPVLDGHLYASPLYQDNVFIQGAGNSANNAGDGVQSPSFQNKTLGIVFAATGGGSVYAIAAQDTNGTTGIAPGTIIWKTHLGNSYAGIDGNSIGVLGTPVIDIKSGRLYVVASVTDYLTAANNPNHGGNNFEVFALNIKDGSLVAGWPLVFTQTLLDSINQNTLNGTGVAVPFSSGGADQRGGLVLSNDGSILYVDFACYGSSNPGWMTTVQTGVTNGVANGDTPAIVSAYSGTDTTTVLANAGMWGAGGPTVDVNGNVFVSTGDSPPSTGQVPGAWGNSVLEWGPGKTLTLTGVWTPWNYQTQDTIDSDLGGGSPIMIYLPAGSSTTTELLAVGGKQGNGYLLNAGNHLNNPTANPTSPAPYPASLTVRPPAVNPNQDPGLYDPNTIRPYFSPAQAGPLALFLPYNETSASGDTAKARDTPATFIGPDGTRYIVWAGSSKTAVGSSTPVAPSMYLTKVVASPGQPAYLQIVAQNTAVMSNPGANIITGNGTSNLIDWIVDSGVKRTDGLTNFNNGAATLYAYDALTLQPIWSSPQRILDMGGKYNTIAAARGQILVGTDRIQAFGVTTDTSVDDAVTGGGANQFTYTGAGWTHPTGTAIQTMGTFGQTVSMDNVAGDFATLTFTGSQIKVYASEASSYGSVTVTVDNANSQSVSLANNTGSPNGQGEGNVLIYTVSGLGAGSHTLKIVNNANSTITIDRVVVSSPLTASSALSVSLTDGNVTPALGAVMSYTINYGNFGSIVDGTGTNATGVVLTETVPANTTADLADSTPGWTLFSGSGGAGSVYKFTLGAVAAGTSGGVVFSVNVNASIPNGTTFLSNTVTITDAANDTASGTRLTPIGPAAAASVIFSQQPSDVQSGMAISPAVTVTVRDQYGNTFTSGSSTVTLTLNNGGTFTGGGNTVNANTVNGVATFSNLRIATAGTFTLTATDGALISATSNSFNVQTPTKLGFTQQPSNAIVGAPIFPAVTVAVQDANGNTVTGDTSTVTLTLNGGTFAGGGNTVTAGAMNGVATFGNLVISATGTYTLTATDGTLTQATSNQFSVGAGTSLYNDFDAGSADFSSNFTVYPNGSGSSSSLGWAAGSGVQDQPGPAAGGGVASVANQGMDVTAVYMPSQVNLSDGAVHTISAFMTAPTTNLGSGNKPLQLGFLAPGSTGFNSGFNFISARILGNNSTEFQWANGGSAVSTNTTAPTGTIAGNDWLDLIFTAQETASGSFQGTFTVIDFGQSGFGPGVTVLGPVAYSVTGLTGMGAAAGVSGGFRVALPSTSSLHYDNFAIDPPGAAELDYLQFPTSATAGQPLGTFVVAVEDLHNHIIATDNSIVTLILSHDIFSDGTTMVSAQAVNGVATFNNLTINRAGSYILRATDTNSSLDPDYAPFTINPASPHHLGFLQQPTTTPAGTAIKPPVSVQILDQYGNLTTSTATVGMTVNGPGGFAAGSVTSMPAVGGVATFSSLILNTSGSYTITASSNGVTGIQSNSFSVVPFGVTSVTPTATGVALQFNVPLDPTVLNMYDQNGQFGPADATLVGTNGAIRGSLVLTNTSAPAGQFDGVTFVATGGSTAAAAAATALTPDTYTLTLVSGANAFKDRNGNALNGGNNFVTTFIVSSPPSEVLNLPSFVRGAGQAVHLPTDTAAGLPVYLNDATGVGSVVLSFSYDNTILGITGFTANPAIPGVFASFSSSPNGATTTVTITVTGTAAFTATPGSFTLGNFIASVPSTAPYGAKGVLHVTSLVVKNPAGTVMTSQGTDGIEVAAYVADGHKDRSYGASDVTLENRLFLAAVTGFVGTPAAPTFPLVDPQLLASIFGTGNVGGSDITVLNRQFLGISNANLPAIPSLGTQPPNGVDPRLFIPTTTMARPGQTITVPVNLEVTDPHGISAGLAADGLVIRYDANVLTFQGIQAGSLFADVAGGFGAYITSVSPGLIKALITSARGTGPLAYGTVGSVAYLTFTVSGTALPGRSVLNLEANDGATTTAVVDNNFETLTLSPAPTNAAGDLADGAVTIVGAGAVSVTAGVDGIAVLGGFAESTATPAAGRGQLTARPAVAPLTASAALSASRTDSVGGPGGLAVPVFQARRLAAYRTTLDAYPEFDGHSSDDTIDLWMVVKV
jgi:hypothetical protein